MVITLTVTMLLAGIGAVLFILAGVRWASMQKLLKEGSYARQAQRQNRIRETTSSVYWLTTTAVFLGWSFLTADWEITWIVWPIAGLLFGVIMCFYKLLAEKDRGQG